MIGEATPRLSLAGQERRRAMLPELLDAMEDLHRRRRQRRRIGAIGVAALGLAATVWLAQGLPTEEPTATAAAMTASATPAPALRGSIITIVHTDPTVIERHRPAATFTATVLDDQKLLATLAEINRPAGLIKMHDQTMLTAAVVD